jgi:GntR family transcriptional repressor for pyruvate dehydrogenase complex
VSKRVGDGESNSTAFSVEPVLRPRQQVESQLRRAILRGVCARGQRLPSESELADQFKVSRSTVREALRSLAEAGFIRKVPGAGGGSFVEHFDYNGLALYLVERIGATLELGGITYDEVAEFRNLLEVPSAGQAAIHRTSLHIERLRAVIEKEKHSSVTDPAVDAYNAEFHRIVAEASGNRLLAAFVTAMHNLAHPLQFIDTSPAVGKSAVKHHIAIVAAISSSDSLQAENCMRDHLEFLRVHAASPVTSGRDRGGARRRGDALS